MKSQLIELLTPRQNGLDLDGDLEKFAAKYNTIVDSGFGVSLPDNPMGWLHYQSTEILGELGLPVPTNQVLIHVNTFHSRKDLDTIIGRAAGLGIRHLLVVTGDGGERLPKLTPISIGTTGNSVTSVELLRFIGHEYPGQFICGVAFNPYEPQDHELEKLQRKLDAGAQFIITQPIVTRHPAVDGLRDFKKPVIVSAWMSKKLDLLSQCVGYNLHTTFEYNPMDNLGELIKHYNDFGLYFALLGLKQLTLLKQLLGTSPRECSPIYFTEKSAA